VNGRENRVGKLGGKNMFFSPPLKRGSRDWSAYHGRLFRIAGKALIFQKPTQGRAWGRNGKLFTAIVAHVVEHQMFVEVQDLNEVKSSARQQARCLDDLISSLVSVIDDPRDYLPKMGDIVAVVGAQE
jgi:hypothetical protein